MIEFTLKGRFAEVVQDAHILSGIGLRVWANPKRKTWTLTGSDGLGLTCVLFTGKGAGRPALEYFTAVLGQPT